MNAKDQLTSLGWSIKSEFFEGNKQRLDEMKKQLLDVRYSIIIFFFYQLIFNEQIFRLISVNSEKNHFRILQDLIEQLNPILFNCIKLEM